MLGTTTVDKVVKGCTFIKTVLKSQKTENNFKKSDKFHEENETCTGTDYDWG